MSQPANTSFNSYYIISYTSSSIPRCVKNQKKVQKSKKRNKIKKGKRRVLGAKIPEATPTPNYISPNPAFLKVINLANVQTTINHRWDCSYFCTEFLFNSFDRCSIVLGDQIDRQSQMTESTRPTNTMQVGFTIFRKVKVDDNIDRLYINTAGEQIGRYQMSCGTIPEFMKDTIPICLLHLCVYVIARISQFSNFFRQQFHSIYRITEDNTLIDLQFCK